MRFAITLFILLASKFCFSQNSIPKVLERLNRKTVPYITTEKLQSEFNYILLDAREYNEFDVSHIKNAVYVGYNNFDKNKASTLADKNTKIIVYCSIGVRSERIGEKFLKMGYKNVYNLYGGIFEWKNKGGKVVDNKGIETDDVHAYNKKWSQYLTKGTKVYND